MSQLRSKNIKIGTLQYKQGGFSMKKQTKLLGIIALIVAIGFSIVGCGGPAGGNDSIIDDRREERGDDDIPAFSSFSWSAGDLYYDLVISGTTEASSSYRSALTSGSYTLIIFNVNDFSDINFSVGTATASTGGQITFAPSHSGAQTFVIMITTSGETANITIPEDTVITFDDGTKIEIEQEVKVTGSIQENTSASVSNDVIGTTLRLHDIPVTYIDQTSAVDFSFSHELQFGYWDEEQGYVAILTREIVPLSEFITGAPEVKITNGKATIKLDTPRDSAMGLISEPIYSTERNITVTPADTMFLSVGNWLDLLDQTGVYELRCIHNTSFTADDNPFIYADLIYVDKDVTLNGYLDEEKNTHVFNNVSLKRGWNYLIVSGARNKERDDGFIFTYVMGTRMLPGSFNWSVYKISPWWEEHEWWVGD
jgi:hypothetical protein